MKLGVEKSRVEMSFNLDTILAIRSASSLGIAKTESTGPMRQLTTGVWGTFEVFKLSYRTIHKFLKVLSVTVHKVPSSLLFNFGPLEPKVTVHKDIISLS